jgi:hypothetical protein
MGAPRSYDTARPHHNGDKHVIVFQLISVFCRNSNAYVFKYYCPRNFEKLNDFLVGSITPPEEKQFFIGILWVGLSTILLVGNFGAWKGTLHGIRGGWKLTDFVL